MPRLTRSDGLDKFARYRTNRKMQAVELSRIWLPAPSLPGFHDEARRQAALLREAPEQSEAQAFIEAVADWPE